jgi:anti-sigma factor RsiW
VDTRHPDEGTIHAYVERQLSPAEQARVEAHVDGCAECAASVAEARGLIAAASRIVAALDDVPVNVIPARPPRRLPPWLAAAAVMVLAVGVSSVAVRSGLQSRRNVATMTADAAGERQAVMPEAQASAALEPAAPGPVTAGPVTAGPLAVTGSAPAARREAAELRSSTVAAAPEPAGKSDTREDAVVLSAPAVSARPSAAPARARVEADFSGTEAGSAVGDRATGGAAPTGRIAARAPAAAPGDAAALSLRQSHATITGRVTTEDGQPLAGANVFINEFDISAGTDATGRYALTIPSDRLEGGAAVVRARAIGYAPQEQLLKVATGSQTADFELRPDRTLLSEVTVAGTTAPVEEPVRTLRYETANGVIVELREFHASSRVPPARPGVNEYRWSDAAGSRRFVLSGPLPVSELRELAARLGELRVVR